MANLEYGSNEGLGPDALISMYRVMKRIRLVEEKLGEDFRAGKLIAGVHLYSGQEAVAAGICAHLNDKDWIASNHRGHGHFLAKGGSVKSLMAEIHAKATGACRGMGGTMHVADFSKGMMGANGIVGGGISFICGAAYSEYLKKSGSVAIAFFGDGAATQGVLSEAMNLSSLWRLPMIFACENNLFSEFSHTSTVLHGELIARAQALEMPAIKVDGNDVVEVWRAAQIAVDRARDGGGPTFIEAMTYRMAGHVEAETGFLQGAQYRESSEVEAWKAKDPIDRFLKWNLETGKVPQATLQELDAELIKELEDAMAFALSSPEPPPEQAFQFMFADHEA